MVWVIWLCRGNRTNFAQFTVVVEEQLLFMCNIDNDGPEEAGGGLESA